jgi:predicted Zn-dependent peptidase
MYSENFKKTVLDSGLTIISEIIPSVRSIAAGVWIKTGSRFEYPAQNGIAHFLEHMMFKGTRKRSPLEIAQSLESIGGHLNAFTGKEVTCYYANALDIHLNRSIEVLSDMVCNSVFPEKEIPRERFVVLEEIKSTKDTPEEHIFDIFHEKLFPDDPLGRPILGTEEIVSGFERTSVVDFWRTQYAPENMVISAAGNLNHDKLVRLVDKYFHFEKIADQKQLQLVENITQSQEFIIPQPINQAHICTGGLGIPYNSEDRFALLVLNAYLGGGMSSRLFQRLREKRGLAYSIYSFTDFYSNIGLFGIYMGTDSAKLKTAQSLLQDELHKLTIKEISTGQLTRIKNQLKGNLVLGLESTSRRMTRLAKNELYFNEYVSIDSLIKNIDNVTTKDIIRLANDIIHPDNFITVILQPAA